MTINKPKEWLIDIRSLGFASIIFAEKFSIYLQPKSWGISVDWNCGVLSIQILCFCFNYYFDEEEEDE